MAKEIDKATYLGTLHNLLLVGRGLFEGESGEAQTQEEAHLWKVLEQARVRIHHAERVVIGRDGLYPSFEQ